MVALDLARIGRMRKLLIVDDHEVVRDGLKKILNDEPADYIFGEASTPHEALKLAVEEDWDLVVLDLTLGSSSGLEVLKELKQIRPQLPVLVLTMHTEEQYARRAFKAGAAAYVTKDSPRAELLRATKKVIDGGKYVSADLAVKLVIELGTDTEREPHQNLSDREYEVFCLIASGKTVGEIAEILSLSGRTISTYRARILEKMGMKSNAQLIYYAIQNKLVS